MKSLLKYPLLLLFFLPILATATEKADSLAQLLNTEIEDTTRLRILRELIVGIRYNDSARLPYLEQAAQLAKRLNRSDVRGLTLIDFGLYYHSNHEFEEAYKYNHAALDLALRHDLKDQLPKVCLNLANTLRRQSNLDSAIIMYQESIRWFDELGERYIQNRPLQGMARTHLVLGNYDLAETHLLEAYDIVKDGGLRMDIGGILFFLAELYDITGAFDKYYDIREKWEEFQSDKNRDLLKSSQTGHLNLLATFGKPDGELIKKFADAVEHFKENGNAFRLGWSYFDLGLAQAKQEQFADARGSYLLALEQFELAHFPDRSAQTYWELYKMGKQLNRPAEALPYLERYHSLTDSLNYERMNDHIAELEVAFETEKKEQLLALQNLEIQQKTSQRNFFIGSSVLIAFLALSIFLGLRGRLRLTQRIAKQEANLQAQKIQRLEQEKQLTALNSMLEGQEKERLRIAQDLHDSLGGLLTTVKAHFNALRPIDMRPSSGEVYAKTNKLIDDASVEVRRISHNMVPKALATSGLAGALQDLAENLETNGIQTNLELVNMEEEIDQSKSLIIFRTIQEITNNIIKHADARNVLIQLIQQEETLSIFVEDDGKGFRLQQALDKGGIGLQNIASRVQFLNGAIDWDSVPGEGTTVNIRVPVTTVQRSVFAA